MSTPTIKFEKFHLGADVVFEGIKFYVSCSDLGSYYNDEIFGGRYELMVFAYDKEDFENVNWNELYCARFKTQEKAARKFISVVDDIGKYIDEDIISELKA